MAATLQHGSRKYLQLEPIPPVLRPLVRAYVLGYASAVAPRLLTLILQHVSRRRRKCTSPERDSRSFIESANHVLRTGLQVQRFPAFCAALVGGGALLQELFKTMLEKSARGLSEAARLRLARWLSSFIAAWFSLRLLQSKTSQAYSETAPLEPDESSGVDNKTIRFAGRTLDLTLFAFTRAVDVVLGDLWSRRKSRRMAARKWTKAEHLLSTMTDPLVFAASSGLIMWSWVYSPERLPRSYNKWITSAASVDLRLIEALRRCRKGELQYGRDTGQAPLLEAMCIDFNWPLQWGNPAKTAPFPCEMVHMGCGPSCEYHAAHRFCRAWKWSMVTSLPLALALKLRNPSPRAFLQAFKSACRSSAFLGAFITLFYYGVCLARTRVGPRLLGTNTRIRQFIDGGMCVGSGCLLCGWSVLLETAARRKDMALFVAPRAMATVVPRRYSLDKQWRETLTFAASAAVVLTCIQENPRRVRGVLGKVLGAVMAE